MLVGSSNVEMIYRTGKPEILPKSYDGTTSIVISFNAGLALFPDKTHPCMLVTCQAQATDLIGTPPIIIPYGEAR